MPSFVKNTSNVKSMETNFKMPINIESQKLETNNTIIKTDFNNSTDTVDLSLAELTETPEQLINVDGNMLLDCDPQGIVEKFGGQADDNGV